MSTETRPEISRRSKYWIPKERYYELKHFCLQYDDWKEELKSCSAYLESCEHAIKGDNTIGRHVESVTEKICTLKTKIGLISHYTQEARFDISKWLLLGVTKGLSYPSLKSQYEIPCSPDLYYEAYRKFFWLLDKERDSAIW